ncbi:MAG: hypothetical protein BMS9Abin37_2828 [Acidobacteriota bacterium]|nr:MAG: hypothetical protein BMS9Abin37_2828 [Acidobacteriota bacterium]
MGGGERGEHRRFLLLLFLVSLVVRASLMIPVAGADIVLQADENEYFSRATAFKFVLTDAARGKPLYSQDISRAYGDGTFPPVHSLFLASSLLVDEDATVARWAVVLLSALTTPLVYLLTLLCSTRKAAFAASGVHVFYPSFVAFSHFLWSETTYIFLLLLATYFTLCLLGPGGSRKRTAYSLLAGCFLGLAALTRAAGLPFLFVFPAWTYLSLRKTSGAATATLLLVAASAIVLSPWEAALAYREKRLVPLSTTADYNLFVGNNPWESSDRFEPDTKSKIAAAIEQYAQAHRVGEHEAARALAVQEIKRAPLAFLERCFHKFRTMWTVDRFVLRHILHAVYPPMRPATVMLIWCVLAFSFLATVGLAVFGLVGVATPLRQRGFLLTLVAIGILPPIITVADTRSSLPLLALLLPAVGHGLAHLGRPRKNGFTIAVIVASALNVLTLQIGRRASSKTSSYYYPLITRVDHLLGSDTPFTDRISLRVEDPELEGEISVILLSDGYRFHVTGNRRRDWIYSPERAAITLNVYAHQPSEPLRMRLSRKPLGRSVIVEPIGDDSWRRWRPSGLRGLEYRWRGGGPPPPNRQPRE